MTTRQQTILYALEQLRRSPWPEPAIDFGSPTPTPIVFDDEPTRAALDAPQVRAGRWTCQLTPEQIRPYLASSNSAPVLIHAIDADPAVPLLAHWARRHQSTLVALVELLRRRLSSSVRLLLPSDLPSAWRKDLKRTPAEWVDAKYPVGHHRMLPYVLGLQARTPLVLDAVAAVQLAQQMGGQPTDERPIAVCDLDRADAIQYRIARASDQIDSILSFDEQTRWIAGPRWRRQSARAEARLGDGELVFFADRDTPGKQSPCIRCGWCEYICPTRCSPTEFLHAFDHDALEHADRGGLRSCIDCGLCTNVCPAELPLQGFINHLKQRAEERP